VGWFRVDDERRSGNTDPVAYGAPSALLDNCVGALSVGAPSLLVCPQSCRFIDGIDDRSIANIECDTGRHAFKFNQPRATTASAGKAFAPAAQVEAHTTQASAKPKAGREAKAGDGNGNQGDF
jgi:hypothetical protein